MKPKVYIETTIPSFFFEIRTEPDMVARREWTREWWENTSGNYELVTSVAVFEELRKGGFPGKNDALSLMETLPLIAADIEVIKIVELYIEQKLMPRDPAGDALHLALASYHDCDFLLTWNCAHLANANKFGHIRRINDMLGLHIPMMVTPLELMGGTTDEIR
jgi:predicted nucleic acid-binding protein